MASDIFAKIGDIKGESLDNKHKDEIEVLSWSWGVTNDAAQSMGGGGGAGKASFHDLSFTHKIDKASPVLMKGCASGWLWSPHFAMQFRRTPRSVQRMGIVGRYRNSWPSLWSFIDGKPSPYGGGCSTALPCRQRNWSKIPTV